MKKEISGISVMQNLRKINFAISGALNFVDLVNFSHQKMQKKKEEKNQNSDPLNVLSVMTNVHF